jgi:hypothetical protein
MTTALSGWGFASQCWALQGLSVVDLDAVASPVVLLDPASYASAFEYAYSIGADADLVGDYNYFGSVHQAEASTAAAFYLDGYPMLTIPAGLVCYGKTCQVIQTMNTYYPKDKVTVIGASALNHTFLYNGILAVAHSHTYSAGYKIYSAYSAMLPLSNADSAGIDTYQVGSNPAAARAYDDAAHDRPTQTDTLVGSHSAAHTYKVRMTLPSGGPDDTGAWTYSGVFQAWWNDLAPSPTGLGKFYVNFVAGDFTQRITAAPSAHRTIYQVVKT